MGAFCKLRGNSGRRKKFFIHVPLIKGQDVLPIYSQTLQLFIVQNNWLSK